MYIAHLGMKQIGCCLAPNYQTLHSHLLYNVVVLVWGLSL